MGRVILFVVGAALLLCGCATPTCSAPAPRKLMLDSLLFRKVPHDKLPTLASGWEMRENSYFRPFVAVPPGVVRYGVGLKLPDQVSATLEFLDGDLQVIHQAAVPAGQDSFVAGSFCQNGELAAVRIVPSEPIISDTLDFSRPFEVTVNWGVAESFAYTVAGKLPENWRGQDAAVFPLEYQRAVKVKGESGFDEKCFDHVLRIQPSGFADPVPDAALLTDNYAWEFSALIDRGVDFSFGGIRLRELYNFTDGIWYRFRLEKYADGKIVFKINGRLIDCAKVPADFVFRNLSRDTELLIDDVQAFALEFPDDYVAPPRVPAGFGKYNLGVTVCSLWRHGSHWGWRCIDQCGDREPVLGYYDEGLPEVADWEIKYMVESGIGFQAFCWYPESHDGPIRHPRLRDQLNDAFKNARYSHLMKYCLIWEIENAGRPHSLEAWKKNYIPYLIEHHFKDPRYLVIDNRVVFAVFAAKNFLSPRCFGSVAKTREAFALLDEAVRELGFDGVMMIEAQHQLPELKAMGFTATINYNHGVFGYKFEKNKERNLLRAEKCPGVFPIPTVSVGFDSIPWHGIKVPNISAEDYRRTILWAKDEFLPKYAQKGTWQENIFWLSVWNEYGEGTYIMPTQTYGFRYLDVVRSIFTDEPADADWHTLPTENQLRRLNQLYPRIGHPLVRSTR